MHTHAHSQWQGNADEISQKKQLAALFQKMTREITERLCECSEFIRVTIVLTGSFAFFLDAPRVWCVCERDRP